jgi:hypothetical protein
VKTWPNFFVVGAARSGTSSLDRYLNKHPEIYIAPQKESHFFAYDLLSSYFNGPGDDRLKGMLIGDEEEYTQLFDKVATEKAIGESSAFYLCLPGTAERIAQVVPDAKIIIILREPVARSYSSYMLLTRDGRETLTFDEGLSREAERKQQGYEPMWWYKELSLYAAQVQRYFEVFSPERVKVILHEEFYAQPQQSLRQLFAFLGVKQDVPIDTSLHYNVSGIPKLPWLYDRFNHLISNPSPLEKRMKSLLPIHLRRAWGNKAIKMLTQPIPLDSQSQMQHQLKEYFAEDVGKLEDVLHRDLGLWRYHELGITQKP